MLTFAGEGGIEDVRSRRLVEFLLFSLSKVGWHLSSSCELPGRSRDTLFFKQGPMVARAYFSVGFDDENTHSIKMIDAPNDARQVFLDTLSVSFASTSISGSVPGRRPFHMCRV